MVPVCFGASLRDFSNTYVFSQHPKLDCGENFLPMASLWQKVTTPFRLYKPGDRITQFTMFDPAHIYDLSDSNGIIPEIDKTTPINVIGPVSTPFTPGEAKRMIAWMSEEEDVRE